MAAECFGGDEISLRGAAYSGSSVQHPQQYNANTTNTNNNGGGGSGSSAGWRREKTRNAFMLVYDRAKPAPQNSHGSDEATTADDRPPPLHPGFTSASSSSPFPPPALSAASSSKAPSDGVRGKVTRRGEGGGGGRVGSRRGVAGRKRFRARVPSVFMREIRRENMEFWR